MTNYFQNISSFQCSKELQEKITYLHEDKENIDILEKSEQESFEITKFNPEDRAKFLNFLYDFVKS